MPPSLPLAVTPKRAVRRKSRFDAALDADLLKALAEPNRARLVSCLLKCGRPCSVTEIAECCDLDFSTVARHLGHLARVGVLTADKQGRTVWYAADAAGLAARFREIAEAIAEALEKLGPGDGCCDAGDCA